MYLYILKRLLSIIPILFVVSVVIFLIVHLTPGDPASFILGEEAGEQELIELREKMGLDAPLYEQYISWIVNVFKGDLGVSYFMHVNVSELILSHLKPTISLTIVAGVKIIDRKSVV